MLYPVAIKPHNGQFVAKLPDIPELEIIDKNMADTIAHARQAVFAYLSDCIEQDTPLPKASEINTYLADPKYAGWTWAIISVNKQSLVGEDIELTVNVSQRLYDKISEHVNNNENENLQTFLVSAIKNALK